MSDQGGYEREFPGNLPIEGRQINSADIEEFARAAVSGVLRAIEARDQRPDIDPKDPSQKPPYGPITWGIWYDPRDPRETPPQI